jgi:hypothetical protein
MEIAPLTRHRSTSVLLLKTSLALYGGEYIVKLNKFNKLMVTSPSPCGRVREGSKNKI